MDNEMPMFPNFDEIPEGLDDDYDVKLLHDQMTALEEKYRDQFTINPEKQKRFFQLYALTLKFLQLIDGQMTAVNAEPGLANSEIIFRTPLLSLGGKTDGEALALFREIMLRADLVSIDPLVLPNDEAEIDINLEIGLINTSLEIGLSVQHVWLLPKDATMD